MITTFIESLRWCFDAFARIVIQIGLFLFSSPGKYSSAEIDQSAALIGHYLMWFIILSMFFGFCRLVWEGPQYLIAFLLRFRWKTFRNRERRISPPVLTDQPTAQERANERL